MDLTAYFKPLPPPSASSQPPTPSLPRTIHRHRHPTPPPPSRDQTSQLSQPPPPPPRALHPRPPPPELSIEPLTPPYLPSFRRITSLLLPIRYPDKFYNDTLADPAVSTVTRVAIWHHRPRPRPNKRQRTEESASAATTPDEQGRGQVVGGIRCRIEDIPATPSSSAGAGMGRAETRVYVQTLSVLSPYRGMGVGTALLEAVVAAGVRGFGATGVYAHVWEANPEALEWYGKRGFEVGEVEGGYYRRLKPGGARVVRRGLGVREYLAVGGCCGSGGGGLGVGGREGEGLLVVDGGG